MKTRYVRTSSGSMMPVYPHATANQEPVPRKISRVKKSEKIVSTKNSNSKG